MLLLSLSQRKSSKMSRDDEKAATKLSVLDSRQSGVSQSNLARCYRMGDKRPSTDALQRTHQRRPFCGGMWFPAVDQRGPTRDAHQVLHVLRRWVLREGGRS